MNYSLNSNIHRINYKLKVRIHYKYYNFEPDTLHNSINIQYNLKDIIIRKIN